MPSLYRRCCRACGIAYQSTYRGPCCAICDGDLVVVELRPDPSSPFRLAVVHDDPAPALDSSTPTP